MKKIILLCSVLVAMSGCALTHDLKFTSYGEMNPSLEREVVSKYKDSVVMESEAKEGVRVYMKTMPPGISPAERGFSVDEDSTRTIVGEFVWTAGGLWTTTLDDAKSQLANIATSAAGNEIVILDAQVRGPYMVSAEGVVLLNKAASAGAQ